MKVILFYFAVALAAAGIILLSLGQSLLPSTSAPQAGAAMDGQIHFDAKSLSHAASSPAHYTYVSQEWLSPVTGLQIATKKTIREPRADARGVRLQLTPQVAAKLSGRPLHISVGVLPLKGGATAGELAVSVQGSGPVNWVRKPITTQDGKLEFELPATAGPIDSIGFWPFSEKGDWPIDLGVEVTSVDIAIR